MQTAANKVYCVSDDFEITPEISKYIKTHLCGKDIGKYYITPPREHLIYLENVETLKDFETLPLSLQSYLLKNKDFLSKRADLVRRKRVDWWRYAFPMHKELYHLKKIWCSYRGSFSCFGYDDSSEMIGFTNTTVIFDTNDEFDIKYILGLVNSKLLEYQHKNSTKQTGGGIYEYFPNTIERYPIVVASKEKQEEVAALVDNIIKIKKNNSSIDTSSIENQIDKIVYELYGLNEEEIAIIEAAIRK